MCVEVLIHQGHLEFELGKLDCDLEDFLFLISALRGLRSPRLFIPGSGSGVRGQGLG